MKSTYVKIGDKFDPTMDANMKYVSRMLCYIEDSKRFTLDKFVGQDKFYKEMYDIWQKFYEKYIVELVTKEYQTSSYSPVEGLRPFTEEILNYAKLFNEIIKDLITKCKLTPNHIVVAIIRISYLYSKNNLSFRYKYPPHKFSEPLSEIKCVWSGQFERNVLDLKEDILIPVVDHNGIFGINSWLQCFFNNIYLISTPIDPKPLHNGRVHATTLANAEHDVQHSYLAKYTGVRHMIKDFYYRMVEKQDKLSLLIMFFGIHEFVWDKRDANNINHVINDLLVFLKDDQGYMSGYIQNIFFHLMGFHHSIYDTIEVIEKILSIVLIIFPSIRFVGEEIQMFYEGKIYEAIGQHLYDDIRKNIWKKHRKNWTMIPF